MARNTTPNIPRNWRTLTAGFICVTSGALGAASTAGYAASVINKPECRSTPAHASEAQYCDAVQNTQSNLAFTSAMSGFGVATSGAYLMNASQSRARARELKVSR